MDDLIKRQDMINSILFATADGDKADWIISVINSVPSAQKTGHWIDKSRGDQKNSECSECHTLFRVLIHDYPYCPVCGSKNRGDEE